MHIKKVLVPVDFSPPSTQAVNHAIEEMETAVRVNKLSEFVSRANKLSSTLRNHIYKEDDILYELAAQVIDAASDEQVLDRLSKFETPLDKDTLSARLQELRSLEWKYLRRQS